MISLALLLLAAQSPTHLPPTASQSALLDVMVTPDGGLRAIARYDGKIHDLDLKLDLAHPSTSVREMGSGGIEDRPHVANNLYRGHLAGDPETRVAAFRVGDELYALILPQDGSQAWTLSPDLDEPGTYEAMSMRDALEIAPPIDCGFAPQFGSSLQPVSGGTSQGTAANRQSLEIALDSDFEFYQWQGGNSDECAAFMVGSLALASLYYEIEFNIRLVATEVIVRTDPSKVGYPYTDVSANLPEVRAWWGTYVGEPFQTVHLFSGRSGAAGTGQAYIGVLCQASPFFMAGYNVAIASSTYGFGLHILTHEIGHNMGAAHTQSGVMSGTNPPAQPGTGGTPLFEFHPHSSGEINSHLSSLPPNCLPGMIPGTEAPVIGAVNPSAPSTIGPGVLTIAGDHMNHVTEVQVDQETVTLALDGIEYLSETKLRVNYDLGAWAAIGNRPVTVSGPGGDSTLSVSVVPPADPHLAVRTYDIFGIYMDLTSTFEPNWTAAVVWSDTNSTSPQGQLQLLDNATVAGVQTLDAAGRATLSFWSPAAQGITPGDTIYMQVVTFHPSNGTRDASDVLEVCVCLP